MDRELGPTQVRIKSDSSPTIGMIVGRVAINGSKSPLDIRSGMTSPLAIESGHRMFSSSMNYRPPAIYNQKKRSWIANCLKIRI